MSVTYGFYNSKNGDRMYDAIQLSSLFDGLVTDGIYASIGTCLVVKADTGLKVNVGIGKAWFKHTWTLNDAILPLMAPISEVLLDRIDAVVLEVDSSEPIRSNSIKFIKGAPSSSPVRPTMVTSAFVNQYALCYISRVAGSTTITQSNITNMVGSTATPFITGILQTVSLDVLLGQWQSELDQFVAGEQAEFTVWFDSIKDILDENVAAALTQRILALEGSTIKKDASGNVAITGNLTLKGSGNYGTKINFGDGDYIHFWEKTDDKLEIKGSGIDLVGAVTVNGKAISTAVNAILSASGWSGSVAPFTQTVSVAGVTTSNNIEVGLRSTATANDVEVASGAILMATAQGSGTVTLKAYGDKPSVSLPISVLIFS